MRESEADTVFALLDVWCGDFTALLPFKLLGSGRQHFLHYFDRFIFFMLA